MACETVSMQTLFETVKDFKNKQDHEHRISKIENKDDKFFISCREHQVQLS